MILVTGASGQLGQSLSSRLKKMGLPHRALTRSELTITDHAGVSALIQSLKPSVVVNCAAYTAVDKAETDQELAFAVNETAVSNLAAVCKENESYLVQISTDFVFGEATQNRKMTPWSVSDSTSPVGVYARSKDAGEKAILKICPESGASIIRTSWLYAAGGISFPATILRLARDPKQERLTVVDDQIGRPTWAGRLADFILAFINQKQLTSVKSTQVPTSIMHFSNSGAASWYDFACATVEMSFEKGLIDRQVPVLPVTSKEFQRPAPRPAYSVLDISESRSILESPHWRRDLGIFLDEVKQRNL